MGDESKIFVYSGNEKTQINETSVIRTLCIYSYYSMPENVYYNAPNPVHIFIIRHKRHIIRSGGDRVTAILTNSYLHDTPGNSQKSTVERFEAFNP